MTARQTLAREGAIKLLAYIKRQTLNSVEVERFYQGCINSRIANEIEILGGELVEVEGRSEQPSSFPLCKLHNPPRDQREEHRIDAGRWEDDGGSINSS
ncbi:MAG: hypothetical protein ACYTDT_11885 [Planctomycetota bacterium]|jgi:hypothetical protein